MRAPGIVINTGEDNYLTTADAVDAAHTVIVSQLLNERFGLEAGLQDWQLGLGHAFEINPALPEQFRLELAHAQLVRELFPNAPLKYMPPTKHMTGNVFFGYLLDAFFNLAGVMTEQSIILVGMMTEGIVTPFLSDRDLALENVRYVRDACAGSPRTSARRRTGSSPPAPARCWGRRWTCSSGSPTTGCSRPSPPAPSASPGGPPTAAGASTASSAQADGYVNPAATCSKRRPPDERDEPRPRLRRHHRRRDGAAVVHPAGARRPAGAGGAAAFAAKMGLDPAHVVHAKAVGPDFTFFVVYGRSSVVIDLDEVQVQEREFPLLSTKEINLQVRSSLGRKLVVVGGTSAPTRTPSGWTRSSTSRGSRGRRGWSTTGRCGWSTSARRSRPTSWSRGQRRSGPTRSWSARSSPSATPTCTTSARSPRRSALVARAAKRPLLVVGGPRFDPAQADELGADRVFTKGTTPREVASYLVHALAPAPTA